MTEHEIAAEEAKARGQIGYYNPNSYPISFSSTVAGRGLQEIEGGAPVLRRDGTLVPYDVDLEAQVSMKMLRHIMPNDPNYQKFGALGDRVVKQRSVYAAPAATVPVKPAVAAVRTAAPGTPRFEHLPSGAVETPEGQIAYRGHKFDSLAALHAFMDKDG